ncbi:hypothetical protein [Deinococcus ficus]|uniref:Uncharacterized protein n=1 Tax=Deinococcus ficus TaxID=317577 RepID=A0A221T2L5_9DEIO|nr:hypothetical protein [Deinococcus ficus]ASN83144.1 hypothetical protein DFI_18255 [Deinococcus ficus]
MTSPPATPDQIQDITQQINRMQRSGMIIRNIDAHAHFQDFAQMIKGLNIHVTPNAPIEDRGRVRFNPMHPGSVPGDALTLLLKIRIVERLLGQPGTPERAGHIWRLLSAAGPGQPVPTLQTLIAALAGTSDAGRADAAALEQLGRHFSPMLDGEGMLPAPRAVINYDLLRTPAPLRDATRLMLYHQVIEESRQRKNPVVLIDQHDAGLADVQTQLQLQSGGNLHVHLY